MAPTSTAPTVAPELEAPAHYDPWTPQGGGNQFPECNKVHAAHDHGACVDRRPAGQPYPSKPDLRKVDET
jgi:hypothetical protein